MRDSARSVRFTRLPSLWGAVALAAAGLLLSGCEVTETTQTYQAPGPMCPQIYEPVCTERRGDERTFPNACEARAAGWRIVADGQCRADYRDRDSRDRDYRDRDYRDRDNRDRDYRDRDSRRDSDRRYDPRTKRTKDRRAAPPAASTPPAAPVRPAPPVQPAPPVRPSPPVQQPVAPAGACPQVYEQVCGQLGDKAQMFMNRCELLRAGAAEVSAGMCMGGNR
jgi:hypothetical protein